MYLSRLRIKDLALVCQIDVEFPKGIVAVTGETGAGKSTILGSIQLLLGERADSSLVRHGCEKAFVEGVFEFEASDAKRIERYRLDGFDVGNEPLIVRREVCANGRAAAFFADQMVTVKHLGELMAETVDIHSQNAQQSLTKRNWQRMSFDDFAGAGALAREVSALCAEYEAKKKLLSEYIENERETRRREDLWRFQIKEVNEANLRAGEEEELLETEKTLSNAEEISELLASLESGLFGEEGSPAQGLRKINRLIKQLKSLYSPAGGWEENMENALAALDDLQGEVARAQDKLKVDPEELAKVQERIALIDRLKKKYGPTVEAVIDETKNLEEKLRESGSFDERIGELEKEAAEKLAELKLAAEKLTKKRAAAAAKFGKAVESEIAPLGMTGMKFGVKLEALDEIASCGAENVEFTIANAGQPMMPLSKIASGGELSRLTLALKCLSLGGNAVQILFFDEIDSGISATVAGAIAERLSLLGGDHQVFVITHMPVIAAAADTHYLVEKLVKEDSATVEITQIKGERRREELSRMLGGNDEKARDFAEKLLKTKGRIKK
ncbi:DNA repair protein RecN [bacterium]|nr:DNA repair protein RecN [bacterium]